jgi:hypothetical protein
MSTPIGSGGPSPIQFTRTSDAAPVVDTATTAAPKQAPIGLTPLAPPTSAAVDSARGIGSSEGAATPSSVRESLKKPVTDKSTPSLQAKQTKVLNQAALSTKMSADAGVSIAKRSFFTKLAGTIVSGVVVGLAAALTAATAGAAAPLLAVACVNFAISAGDAGCAYHNYKTAKDLPGGVNDPNYKPLPMGNSCIDNAIFGTLKACGVSEKTASTAALWTGRAVTIGVGVAAALVSGGATHASAALDIANVVTRSVGATVNIGVAIVGGLQDRSSAKAVDQQQTHERAVAHKRDPHGVMEPDMVLESLEGSRSGHSKAHDQAGLVKSAFTGALSVATVTGVTALTTSAMMNMIRG